MTLKEAAKPMRRGKKISSQRVLLALLERKEPDPAAAPLSAHDVDRARVRTQLESEDATHE